MENALYKYLFIIIINKTSIKRTSFPSPLALRQIEVIGHVKKLYLYFLLRLVLSSQPVLSGYLATISQEWPLHTGSTAFSFSTTR